MHQYNWHARLWRYQRNCYGSKNLKNDLRALQIARVDRLNSRHCQEYHDEVNKGWVVHLSQVELIFWERLVAKDHWNVDILLRRQYRVQVSPSGGKHRVGLRVSFRKSLHVHKTGRGSISFTAILHDQLKLQKFQSAHQREQHKSSKSNSIKEMSQNPQHYGRLCIKHPWIWRKAVSKDRWDQSYTKRIQEKQIESYRYWNTR